MAYDELNCFSHYPHLGLLLYQTLAPSNPTSVGRGSAPASNMDLPAPGEQQQEKLPETIVESDCHFYPRKCSTLKHGDFYASIAEFEGKSYIFYLAPHPSQKEEQQPPASSPCRTIIPMTIIPLSSLSPGQDFLSSRIDA